MSDTTHIWAISIIAIILIYPIPLIWMQSESYLALDTSNLNNLKEPGSTVESFDMWDYVRIYFQAMYFQIPNQEFNALLAIFVLLIQIVMTLVVYILIRSP